MRIHSLTHLIYSAICVILDTSPLCTMHLSFPRFTSICTKDAEVKATYGLGLKDDQLARLNGAEIDFHSASPLTVRHPPPSTIYCPAIRLYLEPNINFKSIFVRVPWWISAYLAGV